MLLKDVNILRHEFIGKTVTIKDKNITGKIIDETKNSFILQTNNTKKRILKPNTTFILETKSGKVEIEGSLIAFRPEDRIKIKKWK